MSSIDQLRAFIAAAETGSFSAAARLRGRAQSTISAAIADLEIDLGVILFDRSGHRPTLTTAGNALLPQARQLLDSHTRLTKKAQAIAEGTETCLTLAFDELIPPALYKPVLAKFFARFPHCRLELLNGAMRDIALLVEQQRAQLGLMTFTGEVTAQTDYRLIGHLRFVAATGLNHPLAEKAVVSREDLAHYLQLLATSRNGDRTRPWARFSPKTWEVENYTLARDLVAENLGWVFLPEHLLDERLSPLTLEFMPVSPLCPVYMTWSVAGLQGPAGRWIQQQIVSTATACLQYSVQDSTMRERA